MLSGGCGTTATAKAAGTYPARGTAHAGAAFVTVLNAITDATFTAARRAGRPRTSGGLRLRRPDGNRRTRRRDDDGRSRGRGRWCRLGRPGGDPGIVAAAGEESWSGCAVRRRPSTSPRHLGLLRVDVAALRRGRVQGGELCEVAGVGPIPVSGAKEILGEAIVKLVITDGVDVLNVTHLGRGPTAAQRAALLWMNPLLGRRLPPDPGRVGPPRTLGADLAHPAGPAGSAVQLPPRPQTRLHWALETGKGKRAFVPPDDPRHPRNQNRAESGAQPSAATGRIASDGPPTEARRHRSTGTAPAAPPGKAGPPRAARQAAAQMTLPQATSGTRATTAMRPDRHGNGRGRYNRTATR